MSLEALSLAAPESLIPGTQIHEQFWRDHFSLCASSGLSRKAYCRENQLVYSRFQYWHHKLVAAKKEKVLQQPSLKPNPSVLLPIAVDAAKPPSSSHLSVCRIGLPSGYEVIVEKESTAVLLFKELLSCRSR